MSSCELCGKEFKFPYLLLRHLNKKNPCSSNTFSVEKLENDNLNNKNNTQGNKNNIQENKNDNLKTIIKCERCEKVFKTKHGLNYHSKICNGVNSLTCPTCLKVFSCCPAKNKHIKNVKCSPPEEKLDMKKEILALRKELAIVKASASKQNSSITNNNHTNINNYTIKYELKYNPETKCITTDDPDAPFPELLCFNGFKLEAARTKLKDINMSELNTILENVKEKKDYDSLYRFFFRNIDNKRLHMFALGRNNNTTHAHVFNNGSIETIDKTMLFDNVSKYIGQYLLNISTYNIDVIGLIVNDPASKKSFIEISKSSSNIFDYFKKAPEMLSV
jgi:hypothetical protein